MKFSEKLLLKLVRVCTDLHCEPLCCIHCSFNIHLLNIAVCSRTKLCTSQFCFFDIWLQLRVFIPPLLCKSNSFYSNEQFRDSVVLVMMKPCKVDCTTDLYSTLLIANTCKWARWYTYVYICTCLHASLVQKAFTPSTAYLVDFMNQTWVILVIEKWRYRLVVSYGSGQKLLRCITK